MPSLFSLFVDLKANTADFVSGMSTASYAAKKAGRDIEESFSSLGNIASVALAPFGELGAVIGESLAERLVVELKDKLDDFAVAPVASAVQGPAVDDVLSALTNLGYQRPAAEKAIEQAITKDKSLAADFDLLFRAALKVIR